MFGLLLSGNACRQPASDRVQGYVEGEFVYVSSPLPGTLETLKVERGRQVKQGELLFVLESEAEKATRDEAKRRLSEAQAKLEDAKKGKRPTELASVEAQLNQARAASALSSLEFTRQEQLRRTAGANTEQDYDKARFQQLQDKERVAELESELKTAQLGSRSDQVAAAEANVRAQEAVLARAEWDLTQKRQAAPETGLIFDTLYREGEWVGAGRPIISLLPPNRIKVRAFVDQARIGRVHAGDAVRVFVDGVSEPVSGKVTFISPRAEFTPPVIYSRESRSKFVYMIEASFDPAIATQLHPGQPVDVGLGQ